MIEQSVIDIKDTCVNQDENNDDSEKDDIKIIPINDDLDQHDIENNEINECVICFEAVTDGSEISKFGCVHAKYMHENCVKSLRQCPLCRETGIIVESSIHRGDPWVWQQHVICFLIGCGFATILFTAMYPMIFFRFGDSNYIINNNTMTNTTLDNYTYY